MKQFRCSHSKLSGMQHRESVQFYENNDDGVKESFVLCLICTTHALRKLAEHGDFDLPAELKHVLTLKEETIKEP